MDYKEYDCQTLSHYSEQGGESTQENAESTQESISRKILRRILSNNPSMTLSDVASEVGSTRDGIRKIADKLWGNGSLYPRRFDKERQMDCCK